MDKSDLNRSNVDLTCEPLDMTSDVTQEVSMHPRFEI